MGAEMLTWRSGRAAAAGVSAVLPDEVLKWSVHGLSGWSWFAVHAVQNHSRCCQSSAETHGNKTYQHRFGVISVAESNFVMKLSSIALFLQMSTIIRSEEKAVAGAARKLFMTPDIFRSLASHITAIQPGFDLLRSFHFASVDDLVAWMAEMSRINYLQEARSCPHNSRQLIYLFSTNCLRTCSTLQHPSRWNGSHLL